MGSIDELRIIKQCQKGNLQDFGLLYDAYAEKIYRFIYYRTQHKATAEDLASAVFLKALDHIQSYQPHKAGFSTWLYQIARNTVIDHYRTFKPAEEIEAVWDLATSANIEQDAGRSMQLEQVRKCLSFLPARQRNIVMMRLWDGLSHKEIADILGMSEAGVKMAFSRTLAKMQKEMALLAMLLLFYQI